MTTTVITTIQWVGFVQSQAGFLHVQQHRAELGVPEFLSGKALMSQHIQPFKIGFHAQW